MACNDNPLMLTHLVATERHLPYGIAVITRRYLPFDTGERAPL